MAPSHFFVATSLSPHFQGRLPQEDIPKNLLYAEAPSATTGLAAATFLRPGAIIMII